MKTFEKEELGLKEGGFLPAVTRNLKVPVLVITEVKVTVRVCPEFEHEMVFMFEPAVQEPATRGI